MRCPSGRIIAVLALTALTGVLAHSRAPGQAAGEEYALLVGVRQYDPTEPLPTLAYPEDDIEELARVLVASGYARENIKVMTQREGATRPRFLPLAAQIRKEFDLTLKRLELADSVVVALAGHGVQFEQDGESFFCPADAALDDERTLIKLGDLSRSLEACRAGFKLLLVDACRNNPKLRVARAAGRPVVDLPSLSRPFERRPPGGVAALFSCSPGEIAYENPELKHGVFFNYVIHALQGEADRDGDGQVDVEELGSFAKKQVARFVDLTYGKEQTPELINRTRGAVAVVRLNAARPVRPEPPKEITNALGMKLTLIPAGEFLMGSPDSDPDAEDGEKPQHRVRITRPFYLGVYEVTQGQYRAVTGASPSAFKGSDELPVETVAWDEAIAFCNKLSEREGLKPYYQFGAGSRTGGEGYRLPTEAEWEYACRAGSTTRYSFGDDAASLGEYAWYDGNSGGKTHPVGQKRPNAWGLFDMHGNVWEWCWDGYDENYYAQLPGVNPAGPSQAGLRVVRGGSWFIDPRSGRSAFRGADSPALYSLYSGLGFRVARDQSSR